MNNRHSQINISQIEYLFVFYSNNNYRHIKTSPIKTPNNPSAFARLHLLFKLLLSSGFQEEHLSRFVFFFIVSAWEIVNAAH